MISDPKLTTKAVSPLRAVLLGAATLAAILAGSAAVQAQEPEARPAAVAAIDLIASLESLCIAAQGDRARVAELALEAGFSPVPEDMVPPLRNSSERVAFMKSNATDMALVSTAKITRRLGRETIVMDYCGVSARPTDHRALEQRLRQTMGFAPVRGSGFEAYVWVQSAAGRAVADELSDRHFLAMAQTGGMRMVAIDRSGTGSTLVYFAPRVE